MPDHQEWKNRLLSCWRLMDRQDWIRVVYFTYGRHWYGKAKGFVAWHSATEFLELNKLVVWLLSPYQASGVLVTKP